MNTKTRAGGMARTETAVNPETLSQAGMQLASLLGDLADRHQELNALVDAQRQALVHGRMEDLHAAHPPIDAAAGAIEALEANRRSLASRLAQICANGPAPAIPKFRTQNPGWEAEPVTLDMLMGHLSADVVAALGKQRSRLKAQIPALKRGLGINAALAENGSRIVHATLGMLTSVVGREGPDRHQLYSARGTTRFGRTQVRSLLNRTV